MRRLLSLALALALVCAGCAGAQDSPLRLPVRVHLLHSSTSAAFTTTRTEGDVRTLLNVANQVWASARIRWELESTVREDAPGGAVFDSVVAGQLPATIPRILAAVPRGTLLVPGWNVFLIRDFGKIAGGMFDPEIAGVVLAERGFGFELTPEWRGGRTLAHELGHSLGLSHVPCDSTRNIMANACSRAAAPSTLTAEQIARARQQASTGRPSAKIPRP